MSRRNLIGLIVLVLSISLASAQAEPIVFPAPTGPYQVGSTYRHWVDESRDELATDDPTDKREIMVRFWYPAEPAPDTVPMPAMPFASLQIPVLNRDFPGMIDILDELVAIQSHTYLDAPLAESDVPFLVLLFSHGGGGMPEAHSLQLEELASHGYIVAATYHTYIASATVFPDGRVAEYSFDDDLLGVADQRFVMDQLSAISSDDPEGFFTGRMETEGFGVFGMSYGGNVARGVCRKDERCIAYANEDAPGGLNSPDGRDSLPPALFMAAAGGGFLSIYERWTAPAYNLRFTTFNHYHFSDIPLWPQRIAGQPMFGATGGIDAVRAVNAYLVAFFDKHLKGEDVPLLDGPSEEFPDVVFMFHDAQ